MKLLIGVGALVVIGLIALGVYFLVTRIGVKPDVDPLLKPTNKEEDIDL